MSMSTLGRQLAAINAAPGKTNAGSIFSTSRRHDDAIGRGLSHSVQIGHSLTKNLYKPSIIHEDAKKASDVPMATIRENCVASLRQLEELDDGFGSYINILCKQSAQERGLLTVEENEFIDKTIEDLMYRLSLRMSSGGTNKNSILASCLHIIEFLLRKYDMHIRPKTASAALLTMLPLHEQPFFLRLLQLIDLANLPEWSFLRPYAAPRARLGRSVISQQASKDVALLRSLGKLSQRNATLPCCEKSLSFTAAVLVEALTLQTQRKGTVDERTCQALLPFIVAACRNHKGIKNTALSATEQVWRNWGYVLASTLVETSMLAVEPRNLLVTSILDGLVKQKHINDAAINKHSLSSAQIKQMNQDFVRLMSNAFMVALTILLQGTTWDLETHIEESAEQMIDCRLPIWPSANMSETEPVLHGFFLNKETLTLLLSLDDDTDVGERTVSSSVVADCLGYLYGKQGIVEVKHWIASVLVIGWKSICKGGTKEKKKKHCWKTLNMMLSIIQRQPDLLNLWNDQGSQWAESYSTFLIANLPISLFSKQSSDGQMVVFPLLACQRLLDSMRALDPLAYERGVARSMLRLKNRDDGIKVAKWLGFTSNDRKGGPEEAAEPSTHTSLPLPPRVALEHADSANRLNAISTLLQEAKDEDRMPLGLNGETIAQAFLRRFLMDSNEDVALGAGSALKELIDMNSGVDGLELAEGALDAFQKWYMFRNASEDTKAKLLVLSCHFASRSARDLISSNGHENVLARLLEALALFLDDSREFVSLAAANGILFVWNKDCAKKISLETAQSRAKTLLSSDVKLVDAFRRAFEINNPSELAMRRQFVKMFLGSLVSSKKSLPQDIFGSCVEYCVWAMDTFSSDMRDDELQTVAKYLLSITKFVASTPDKLLAIVCQFAKGTRSIFRVAVAPFVREVCKKATTCNGTPVAPLAILMEMILSATETLQIENFASVTHDLLSCTDDDSLFLSLVPMLALTSSAQERVREVAVDLLTELSNKLTNKVLKEEHSKLAVVPKYFSKNKSCILFGGPEFLSQALSAIISTTDPEDAALIRRFLIKLIVCSAAASGTATAAEDENDPFDSSWLEFGRPLGGYRAAAVLLSAIESAGEDSFPLLLRWEYAGKLFLDKFLEFTNAKFDDQGYLSELISLTVRMLKGTKTKSRDTSSTSSRSTIIMSIPTSSGRRSRSYSFGKSENVSFLQPYPKDMQNFVATILASDRDTDLVREIVAALFHFVLGSSSWQKEVFCQLTDDARQRMATAILDSLSNGRVGSAEAIFLSLPLKSTDIAKILCGTDMDDLGLTRLSFAADYIAANAGRLVSEGGFEIIAQVVFNQLSNLFELSHDDDSINFTRTALLTALQELVNATPKNENQTNHPLSNKNVDAWTSILQEILVGDSARGLSLRTAKTALFILKAFCERFPSFVVPKIVPIVTGFAGGFRNKDANMVSACFNIAVPTFLAHANATGRSSIELFAPLISTMRALELESRVLLMQSMVGALGIPHHDDTALTTSPVGSFITAVLAKEVFDTPLESKHKDDFSRLPRLSTQILSKEDSVTRVFAVMTMQGYAKDILFHILKTSGQKDYQCDTSLADIFYLADDKSIPTDCQRLENLFQVLTVTICDILAGTELGSMIKGSSKNATRLLLSLWQDFFMMRSLCHAHQEVIGLVASAEVLGQSIDWIEKSVPSHVYLAFVSHLMNQGESEDIRCSAMQLITDRSASFRVTSPESQVFVEMIPSLIEVLKANESSSAHPDSKGNRMRNAALVAIDSIGRNCYLSSEVVKEGGNYQRMFLDTLGEVTALIEIESHFPCGTAFADIPAESRQLVSSAALCASTAIRICGPQAIRFLPKLIVSLMNTLALVSTVSLHLPNNDGEKRKHEQNQARLIQASLLRAVKSIILKLPLQVKQFLNRLLKELAQVAAGLDADSSGHALAVVSEYQEIVTAMTASIPSRQLVPAVASTATLIPTETSAIPLLKIMNESVEKANGVEISSQLNLILHTACSMYDRDDHKDATEVRSTVNELLMSFVMKQSEVQLRVLYQKLLMWRDDTEAAEVDRSDNRKLAFWDLSSSLSKSLKSIYLPCLTVVFADAIKELEGIVASVVKGSSKKIANGRKKQRLSEMVTNVDNVQIATLKCILHCLETSLHADAQNGGLWVREMDAQRYNDLLHPLGKLMHMRLPCDESDISYQAIVEGVNRGTGSVVGCIVALASAVGDEQLWKPLNHAVLQACRDVRRREVRKAGVTCLLSLVKAIGEEYMVLIPECLPTLAELLEDSDEEIAGLARECISQSEEVLGESLQDSLM